MEPKNECAPNSFESWDASLEQPSPEVCSTGSLRSDHRFGNGPTGLLWKCAANLAAKPLALKETRGWRAADSGTQSIRLVFDTPQRLTRIAVAFEETVTERSQEFVMGWSGDGGRSFREIV